MIIVISSKKMDHVPKIKNLAFNVTKYLFLKKLNAQFPKNITTLSS
jgi:hypothetical protein